MRKNCVRWQLTSVLHKLTCLSSKQSHVSNCSGAGLGVKHVEKYLVSDETADTKLSSKQSLLLKATILTVEAYHCRYPHRETSFGCIALTLADSDAITYGTKAGESIDTKTVRRDSHRRSLHSLHSSITSISYRSLLVLSSQELSEVVQSNANARLEGVSILRSAHRVARRKLVPMMLSAMPRWGREDRQYRLTAPRS